MRIRRGSVVALAVLTLWQAASVEAQTGNGAPRPPPEVSGYLKPGQRPDHMLFLPPPPPADSVLGAADMALYRATRALEGSARWQLATRDAEIAQRNLLADFRCALGVDLTGARAPATIRLLTRASADLFPLVGASKDHYRRPRPFLVEDLPLCVVPSQELARGGSYPSGHSATGWLYALLLAETAPDRAAAIMARGRAYGESRVVCGVHYLSDVEGGRTLATTLVAALNGNTAFERDVVAARRELARLRAKGAADGDAAACASEAGELKTPW